MELSYSSLSFFAEFSTFGLSKIWLEESSLDFDGGVKLILTELKNGDLKDYMRKSLEEWIVSSFGQFSIFALQDGLP